MKLPLLQLFAQMMPVLLAREALHEMTVAAMGSGSVKKAEAQRIRSEWVRQANVARKADLAAMPPEVARARVAALGFTVVDE